MTRRKLKYVDLFAGCGGLSLGLEQAGFELELAVEKSPMAAETFYHNLIKPIETDEEWKKYVEAPLVQQAKSKLVVAELEKVIDSPETIADLKQKNIDLVAGGPPCQGFSLAGRRNPEDLRNQLPWQFLEFVEMIDPKAVVIENVSGMAQNFAKHGKLSPFAQLGKALEEIGKGYFVQPMMLNAMHFGAPQHRPRVMLIGIRKDVAKTETLNIFNGMWRSEFEENASNKNGERPTLAPVAKFFGDKIRTVADAIGDLTISPPDSSLRKENKSIDWKLAKSLPNHALRGHSEKTKLRFRLYQALRDNGIKTKVLAISKKNDVSLDEAKLLLRAELGSIQFPLISPDGAVVAKTLNKLVELAIELATKKHSQRPLSWSVPSPTIVSMPDDYVHPSEARTFTVREMARFQSFPDTFIFRSKETTGSLRRRFEVPQYTQVGNAVPPIMARAVGEQLKKVLLQK